MQYENIDMQNEERKQRTPEQKKARAEYMREYRIDKKRAYKEACEEWQEILSPIIEEVKPVASPLLYVLLLLLRDRKYTELNAFLLRDDEHYDETFQKLYRTIADNNPLFSNHQFQDDFVTSYYKARNERLQYL